MARPILRTVNRFGYDIRPLKSGFHHDPFGDQVQLMRGSEVKTILDVGGNWGETARQYCDLFPEATVHTFEPNEASFQKILEQSASYPRLKPHALAVAESTGTKTFFLNNQAVTSSLLPTGESAGQYIPADWVQTNTTITVPSITLDDFCDRANLGKIEILKLDVQGAELLAIQGAVGLLRRSAIDLILCEVGFTELYQGQASFLQVSQALANDGYTINGIYNLMYGKNNTLGWGDAIFVSEPFRKTLVG